MDSMNVLCFINLSGICLKKYIFWDCVKYNYLILDSTNKAAVPTNSQQIIRRMSSCTTNFYRQKNTYKCVSAVDSDCYSKRWPYRILFLFSLFFCLVIFAIMLAFQFSFCFIFVHTWRAFYESLEEEKRIPIHKGKTHFKIKLKKKLPK